jgi:uncharacterized tellurite resistance protein B-like protein
MFDRLLEFISAAQTAGEDAAPDELQLAVAALLVEAARMDASFGAAERATIERLLASRFDLDPGSVAALIAAAEEKMRDATQYFPFTHRITTAMSTEERVAVIEMLWEVAYADGRLDPSEDALLRQIAGLIHVPDRDRGMARKRALERIAARKDKEKAKEAGR